MLFNTYEFWLFFIPVLILVHILPHRGQNTVLLLASYIFYGAWDWRFLSLILISTVVDYFMAPLCVSASSGFKRKLALVVSIVVNLSILGFFKYYDFFVQSFADFVGIEQGRTNGVLLNIILPVGISFYTFQTMSYTLDVYFGKLAPVKSFRDFALYVAFFPQLVAGPIERGERLIPQITQKRTIDPSKMESACHLIAWGLFKKVIIADTLAHPVNSIYASSSYTGPLIYLATICFAVQIYCDFSGYSDIARGLARLMGIDLMLNFNLPYISKNPVEFWRRWHISLSTWLRDYLYIPLGGNRGSKMGIYRNVMITMVLGGLWHGARFNFVLWGFYHGIILVLYRMIIAERRTRPAEESKFLKLLKVAAMFHIILFGWLLFRVESGEQLGRALSALLVSWTNWYAVLELIKFMAPVCVILILMQIWQYSSGELEVINKMSWPVRAIFFGLCVSAVLLLNQGNSEPFIYFQF
jgi:D-alanyl-lipoteichoic acid acyltransferase DltB (MBOAT superfamily)